MLQLGMPTEFELMETLRKMSAPDRKFLDATFRSEVSFPLYDFSDNAQGSLLASPDDIRNALWSHGDGTMTQRQQLAYGQLARFLSMYAPNGQVIYGGYPGAPINYTITAPGGGYPYFPITGPGPREDVKWSGTTSTYGTPYETVVTVGPGVTVGAAPVTAPVIPTLPPAPTPQPAAPLAAPAPVTGGNVDQVPCSSCAMTGAGFTPPSTGWNDNPLPVSVQANPNIAPVIYDVGMSGTPAGQLVLKETAAADLAAGDDVNLGLSWKVILILVLAGLTLWYTR